MKKTHFMSTPKPDLSAISLSMARKNRPRDLLLRRLRQYFLYSKLRSLLPVPPQPLQLTSFVGSTEMATEYEPPRHEIPRGDFDEDRRAENNREEKEAEVEEEDDFVCECHCLNDNDEDGDEVVGTEKAFVPSIKIKRMDNSLLISTVVLKDVALSSSLFLLLEEEKLNIIFENQYRTETKVSHTLQVRVPLDYDVDVLERKLQKWARTGTHL